MLYTFRFRFLRGGTIVAVLVDAKRLELARFLNHDIVEISDKWLQEILDSKYSGLGCKIKSDYQRINGRKSVGVFIRQICYDFGDEILFGFLSESVTMAVYRCNCGHFHSFGQKGFLEWFGDRSLIKCIFSCLNKNK